MSQILIMRKTDKNTESEIQTYLAYCNFFASLSLHGNALARLLLTAALVIDFYKFLNCGSSVYVFPLFFFFSPSSTFPHLPRHCCSLTDYLVDNFTTTIILSREGPYLSIIIRKRPLIVCSKVI